MLSADLPDVQFEFSTHEPLRSSVRATPRGICSEAAGGGGSKVINIAGGQLSTTYLAEGSKENELGTTRRQRAEYK